MLVVLAEASLRAIAMGVVTVVVLRLFGVHDARVRHAAWTCVLLLMLALPVAVTWGPRARVPIRAAEPIVRAIGLDQLRSDSSPIQAKPESPMMQAPIAGELGWRTVALAIYACMTLAFSARLANGVVRIRRLLRAATPRDGYMTHPACVVPVTVGWWRQNIVLPVTCAEWPAERLAMVLAHERAHVRRRDSVVQLLSLVNRAVFWFHPLAWWLHRELAAVAEEACDAAAATRHDRSAYAGCLIAMAREARRSGRRLAPTAIAMASTALPRRVRAILAEPRAPAPRRVAGATIVTLPLLIVCLSAAPVDTMAVLRAEGGDSLFRGFTGTFVLINDSGSLDIRYNAERADVRFSPCSTFKWPLAALFLDRGIVETPGSVLEYDIRLERDAATGSLPETRHDQTLTSAFRESATWYFDALARSLDAGVVERFMERAQYGNAHPRDRESGRYWYDGQLRISPNEQVRFLRRLHNGELGLSMRTTELVNEVAQVETTPRWRLAGKTGACQAVGDDTTTNWYIGWVEKADDTYYFALQLEASGFDRVLRERVPIAREFLTHLRVLD